MGRSFTEPEVKLVPNHLNTFYISRTRDPDDEFACEQAMTWGWEFVDVDARVKIAAYLDDFLVIDGRYAATMALQGWKGGRDSIEVHYS